MAFLILAGGLHFSHAATVSTNLCCTNSTYGLCKNVPSGDRSSCTGTVESTSCDQTSFCRLGTCVSQTTGACTPNVAKQVCETPTSAGGESGKWYQQSRDNLPQCKRGCCIIGNQVSFVTQTDCKATATTFGVPIDFRPEITSEAACSALVNSQKEGACVFKGAQGSKDCSILTQNNCNAQGGEFHEGLLCTAENLGTNCVLPKNPKTECFGGKVYNLDTCGQRANIVDTVERNKNPNYYSTYIISPNDVNCTANPNNPSCGNCNFADSTKCSQVSQNDARCVTLDCKYQGKTYTNGESWCATVGAPIINVSQTEGLNNATERQMLQNDYTTQNIPGSRYYTVSCHSGQITVEPCADYRNQVCKQTTLNDGTTYAQCKVNNWRSCFNITNKTACDATNVDCKWIGGSEFLWGYRYDGKVYPWNGETTGQGAAQLSNRNEYQGSCVPLYAPGFDFWDNQSTAGGLCSAFGNVVETANFETGVLVKRTNFANWSTKAGANYCFSGACYAIPDFGLDTKISNLTTELGIYLGKGGLGTIGDLHLSDRKGYYCNGATGKVGGILGKKYEVSCAGSTSKRADIPLFLNNGLWVDYLQERARSIGDCGYKLSVSGQYGQASTESISNTFQILDQKGGVKKNLTESTLLFNGNSRLTIQNGYRGSNLFTKTSGSAFYWRNYNWWNALHPGQVANLGLTYEEFTSGSTSSNSGSQTSSTSSTSPGVPTHPSPGEQTGLQPQ